MNLGLLGLFVEINSYKIPFHINRVYCTNDSKKLSVKTEDLVARNKALDKGVTADIHVEKVSWISLVHKNANWKNIRLLIIHLVVLVSFAIVTDLLYLVKSNKGFSILNHKALILKLKFLPSSEVRVLVKVHLLVLFMDLVDVGIHISVQSVGEPLIFENCGECLDLEGQIDVYFLGQ